MASYSDAGRKAAPASGSGFAVWATGIVVSLAVAATFAIHQFGQSQTQDAVHALIAEEQVKGVQAGEVAENALKQIYQNIRTLSFLPDIRAMDRHATNIGEGARQTIQQIYNNLASNVSVSEVYFIPAEFTPGQIDPVTGKPEEPALMYDQLIAGNDPAAQDEGGDAGQPEIEDEEYALIAKQIAYFKANFATSSGISGMNVPMVSGPPVATCDNTDFNRTLKEYDRAGLVLSVPYFRPDGVFGGMVSAVVRLRVLEAILPKSDAALVHKGAQFAIFPEQAGQAKLSEASVLKGMADPDLLYSQAIRLDLPDQPAEWTLWRGLSNESFDTAPQLVSLRSKVTAAHSIVWVLALLSILAAWIIDIRFIRPARRVVTALVTIAAGQIETDVPLADRRDLLGDISRAVTRFKQGAQDLQRAEQDRSAEAERSLLLQVEREDEARQRAASITTVVEHLGAGLKRLAQSNISQSIDERFTPEFEQVRQDFNASIAAFQVTLEEVLTATVQIHDSSVALSEGASGVSQRSERQAAALEQAAAALEQITVTVGQLTGQAEDARALAGKTRLRANASGGVVTDAVAAMGRIQQSASEISQIIAVINGIAFQTNLLALNAGVEAARAGDAGKGFAVVAQEVRELAQRSAAASQQIKTLIEGSASEVQHGVALVEQTGHALQEITDMIVSMDVTIDAIATGIREQSASLSETSGAVQQLDNATQENASVAEQIAGLSRVVNQQAQDLSEQAQRFKLNPRRGTSADMMMPALNHRAA